MKIISRNDANLSNSPEERKVWKYSFPEYEFQYDEQFPHTIIKWHHHARIWETIYIVEGKLAAKWREDGEEKEQIVKAGDVIEPGHGAHTFENRSESVVKFIAFKRIPSGKDMREMIEKDKIYDE